MRYDKTCFLSFAAGSLTFMILRMIVFIYESNDTVQNNTTDGKVNSRNRNTVLGKTTKLNAMCHRTYFFHLLLPLR